MGPPTASSLTVGPVCPLAPHVIEPGSWVRHRIARVAVGVPGSGGNRAGMCRRAEATNRQSDAGRRMRIWGGGADADLTRHHGLTPVRTCLCT